MYLKKPTDAEIKVDLVKLEDNLNMTSILIAQELVKVSLAAEEPNLVEHLVIDEFDGSGPSGEVLPWWLSWSQKFDSSGPAARSDKDKVDNQRQHVFEAKAEKEGLWAKLTLDERKRIMDIIEPAEECKSQLDVADNSDLDKYIAHKINVTLSSLTVSLTENGPDGHCDIEREVLVINLNQFVCSLETRPSSNRFKGSLRAENFVVEGLAGGLNKYELIPIITAEKSLVAKGSGGRHCQTNHKAYVFGLDVEKNPSHCEAAYSINGQCEPIEVLYQRAAFIELANYISCVPALISREKLDLSKLSRKAMNYSKKELVKLAINSKRQLFVDIDLKAPYVVVPEGGALEKGGRVLLIDFGRLEIKSEPNRDQLFEPPSSSLELEEYLFDRTKITLSNVQILFSDSHDEWRLSKEMDESEMHIMPRLTIQSILSRSRPGHPDQLPSVKLNLATNGIRFNLSDRRLRLLEQFMLDTPFFGLTVNSETDSFKKAVTVTELQDRLFELDGNWILKETSSSELRRIRIILNSCKGVEQNDLSEGLAEVDSSQAPQQPLSSLSSITMSKLIDVQTFESVVTESNKLKVIVRLSISEVLIHLSRSSDKFDQPYLMLRLESIGLDCARTTFGHAVQVTLRKMILVDKQHACSSGGYLELIGTSTGTDHSNLELVNLFYRKVNPLCKEFSSTFNSNAHALKVELGHPQLVFHRDSLISMSRFLTFVRDSVPDVIAKPIKDTVDAMLPEPPTLTAFLAPRRLSDLPLPLNSNELLVSLSLKTIRVEFRETDVELCELALIGLKIDFIKNSTGVVLNSSICDLKVRDECDKTLYVTVFEQSASGSNGEKTFVELVYKCSETECRKNTSSTIENGSVSLKVASFQLFLLSPFLRDIIRVLEPFKCSKEVKLVEDKIEIELKELKFIEFSVELEAPLVLVPQNKTSNNVLVVKLDKFVIKNCCLTGDNQSSTVFQLNGVRLARGSFIPDTDTTDSHNVQQERLLLEPFEAECQLLKINSTSVSVEANLGKIRWTLDKSDINALMAIFSDSMQHDCSTQSLEQSDQEELDISGDELDSKVASTKVLVKFDEVQLVLIKSDSSKLCCVRSEELVVELEHCSKSGLNLSAQLKVIELLDIRDIAKVVSVLHAGPYELVLRVPSANFALNDLDVSLESLSETFRAKLSLNFLFEMYQFFDCFPKSDLIKAKVSNAVRRTACMCSKITESEAIFGHF